MARTTAHVNAPAASRRPDPVPDATDRVIHQWAKVRPDLNVSPIGVVTRLERLRAIIAEEQEAAFAAHGISNPAFTTLVTLVRINQPGGVSQRRLADEMGLTPGTVSVRIDRLAADGVVARSPDPGDKRGSLVSLTDRGRELFETVVPADLANEARLLGSLTPAEQATLAGLLRKLLVAFEGSAELIPAGHTAAEFNQARMPGARYTKSFNTLTAAFQRRAAARSGGNQVVQWLCGDDRESKAIAASLITDSGFLAVDLGGTADATVMEAPRRAGAVYGEEYRGPDAQAVVAAVRDGRPLPPTPSYPSG